MNLRNSASIALLASLAALLPAGAIPRPARHSHYLHTSGSRILDDRNRPVSILGINWFGLETKTFAPQGLGERNLDDLVGQMKALGFNTIRLPYSDQILENTSVPAGINYQLNPRLAGLSSLQLMDMVVASARAHGMWVILDRHRPDASGQSALWYTPQVPESEWIADLQTLALRYASNDTVIGMDLHNEPHDPATWGDNNPATDWRLAATRAGDAVLGINPRLLVFVQGVQSYNKATYWWGGNLSAAGEQPVALANPHQLVYEAHDYCQSVYGQQWFKDAAYPANLPQLWHDRWGYLADDNSAPVVLGEFGSRLQTENDQQWMSTLVAYLKAHNISAMYWSLNPDSSDTGGILRDDWNTVQQPQMAALEPLVSQTSPARGIQPRIQTASVTAPPPPAYVPVAQIPSPVHDQNRMKNTAYAPARAQSFPAPAASVRNASVTLNNAGNGRIQVHPVVADKTSAWWGELNLAIDNDQPLTALQAVVTVHRTPGVKPAGQYNTLWNGAVDQGTQASDGAITYTYQLKPGLNAGPGHWLLAAQYGGNGTPRVTAADSWRVEAVSNGRVQVAAGHF